MKLALGTVQFGTAYGVSNRKGQPSADEVARILSTAHRAGIRIVDTAPLYGESELVLGRVAGADDRFDIVTKTESLVESARVSRISQIFRQSLDRLRRGRVYGLLVHHASDLALPSAGAVVRELRGLKDAGLVAKIGASVYTGADIDRVLELFTPDIVQLPLNVFDQRLIRSGHLERLKERGVEIHCRSVFLQGLLLMEPERLHSYFSAVRPALSAFQSLARTSRVSPLKVALEFAKRRPEIDRILVGVCAEEELAQVLEAYLAPDVAPDDMAGFAQTDEAILNPALWKLI